MDDGKRAFEVMVFVVLDSVVAVRRCLKLAAQGPQRLGDKCAVAL